MADLPWPRSATCNACSTASLDACSTTSGRPVASRTPTTTTTTMTTTRTTTTDDRPTITTTVVEVAGARGSQTTGLPRSLGVARVTARCRCGQAATAATA